MGGNIYRNSVTALGKSNNNHSKNPCNPRPQFIYQQKSTNTVQNNNSQNNNSKNNR